MSQIVIAIDGPAASGKGTVSKAISKKLHFNYLDTGKLYRTIGAKYLEGYQPIAAAQSLERNDLDKYNLQKPEIAKAASEIASIPEVRAALLEFQRNFSQKLPGAVLDGRDIGSVIFLDAGIKFFVTADLVVRAKRRKEQYKKIGQEYSIKDIAKKLEERDRRDKIRKASPLICMPDAIVYDNSKGSFKRLNKEIIEIVEKKYKSLELKVINKRLGHTS